MHVWLIAHYASPATDQGGSSRHRSLARELIQRGCDVSIIAALTQHPSGKRRVLDDATSTEAGSIRWRFLRAPEYRGNGLARILNMVWFACSALMPSSTRGLGRPGVVIGRTVHPLAAWAALRLAKRFDVPFVLEIGDLWPETLIDMGALSKGHPLARLLRRLEGYLCRNATRIVVTMPRAGDYLVRTHRVDPRVVEWISMGTEVETFETFPVDARPHFELRYFGSLGRANGVDQIIQGFARARTESVAALRLGVLGGGPEQGRLEQLAVDLGVGEYVTFHPAVRKEEVPRFAGGADALIMVVLPLGLYRYGISMNKLFDYLASQRPIVFAGDPVNNPVSDADAGVVVREVSPASICEGILQMQETDVQTRARWGLNGRRHVAEHYSYAVLGERFDQILREVVTSA